MTREPALMIFVQDYRSITRTLSSAQKGELLDALMLYADSREEYSGGDPVLRAVFWIFADKIARNQEAIPYTRTSFAAVRKTGRTSAPATGKAKRRRRRRVRKRQMIQRAKTPRRIRRTAPRSPGIRKPTKVYHRRQPKPNPKPKPDPKM